MKGRRRGEGSGASPSVPEQLYKRLSHESHWTRAAVQVSSGSFTSLFRLSCECLNANSRPWRGFSGIDTDTGAPPLDPWAAPVSAIGP